MPSSRKPFNPLACIPEPRIVRAELEAAEQHVARLKVVLTVAEQVHGEPTAESARPPQGGASRGN